MGKKKKKGKTRPISGLGQSVLGGIGQSEFKDRFKEREKRRRRR